MPNASIGMIAETSEATVIVIADRAGIGLLDLKSCLRTAMADPENGREGVGYNDGKVDGVGRLWVGTAECSETEPRGCLWVIADGQAPRLVDSGMTVVNGPAFSPRSDIVYVSDSTAKRIMAHDLREGTLSRRRTFAQMSAEEGYPDGLTVDAEGCLWCAHWDGGRVTRFSPSGERLLVITLPAPRVTSVAFGGPDLNELFITTARYGLSDEQLNDTPHAGGLFRVRTGIQGLAAHVLPLPFRAA
jgi:sugar lactone lactonase YvrE